MSNLLIIVNNLKDWNPYFPTDQVVSGSDYLFLEKYQENEKFQIINLCKDLSYQSVGYYCSLIAEARGHKILPDVKTINDLSKKSLYLYDLNELEGIRNKISFTENYTVETVFKFKIFFGEVEQDEFQGLATQIFDYFPSPLLEVSIGEKSGMYIRSVGFTSLKKLSEAEEFFFSKSIDQYSNKIWRQPKDRDSFRYDLAILVNEDELMPPSNQKALENFSKACQIRKVFCEFITKKDFKRIREFDALFIRETTSSKNHTYRFAKRAYDEGLAVCDDPVSILRCTNKIYLSNLLSRLNLRGIPGDFISSSRDAILEKLIDDFGLPLVIKVPDGSFSVGVSKVETKDDLKRSVESVLKNTDLVLVQKFMYTTYDWRIGVIGGEPIFACKYFMSKNHWQIYNHDMDKKDDKFSGLAVGVDISDVPRNILDAAVKISNRIGSGLYGVDIKENENGGVFVVEVNDNPNVDAGIEDQVLGFDLYLKIIDHFITEIEKNSSCFL